MTLKTMTAQERQRRIDARAYAVFVMIFLGIGMAADVYAIEPLMEWLREGDWPTWWIVMFEIILSIPRYYLDQEATPHLYNVMSADSAPWWALTLAGISAVLSAIVLVTYPFVLIIAAAITLFLGVAALMQVTFFIVWPYMLAGLGLWILQEVFRGRKKKKTTDVRKNSD